MSPPPQPIAPPVRWMQPWLAALPPLYVISPLALLALPALRQLPPLAWYALVVYAVSQQLPALFTSDPVLSSALTLARTLLMFGLIGMGVALAQTERLRLIRWGLVTVYATALGYTWLGGTDVLIQRLHHPYMTPITLGMAGAFGIWLALFSNGRLLWRLALGLLALAVLLVSGSRGPLAAALIGCIAGLVIHQRRMGLAVLAGAIVLAGGLFAGQKLEVGAINRLGSADTTGRDIVWHNTLSVIRSEPWTGTGSYRLGTHLAPPGESCELFTAPDGKAPSCPEWIDSLGSPWLIAHNASLQQLAETGPVGLLGLMLLLATVIASTLQSRDSLGIAVIFGMLISTANDNTLLVPSPFFAEFFWVVAGIQLRRLQTVNVSTGVVAAGFMLVLSWPLLVLALPTPSPAPMQLTLLNAPTRVLSSRDYSAFLQVTGPPGKYRASLNSCLDSCAQIDNAAFSIDTNSSPVILLRGNLRSIQKQRLELQLYPGQSSLQIRPLAVHRWTVQVSP